MVAGRGRALPQHDELDFTVDQYSEDGSRFETTLSRSCNVLIARGAYDAAVASFPYKRMTLRHGCRLIEEHKAVRPARPD